MRTEQQRLPGHMHPAPRRQTAKHHRRRQQPLRRKRRQRHRRHRRTRLRNIVEIRDPPLSQSRPVTVIRAIAERSIRRAAHAVVKITRELRHRRSAASVVQAQRVQRPGQTVLLPIARLPDRDARGLIRQSRRHIRAERRRVGDVMHITLRLADIHRQHAVTQVMRLPLQTPLGMR